MGKVEIRSYGREDAPPRPQELTHKELTEKAYRLHVLLTEIGQRDPDVVEAMDLMIELIQSGFASLSLIAKVGPIGIDMNVQGSWALWIRDRAKLGALRPSESTDA